MTSPPDRNKIKIRLETELRRLRDDLNSVIESLNRLGSTAAPAGEEERRAEEYKALEFKGSMVQMQLTLYEIVISHAEYCDNYIGLNDECHKGHSKTIRDLKDKIKPFTDIKRDFLGVANLASLAKKSPLKFVEWGAILAAAKYLHLFDSVPK